MATIVGSLHLSLQGLSRQFWKQKGLVYKLGVRRRDGGSGSPPLPCRLAEDSCRQWGCRMPGKCGDMEACPHRLQGAGVRGVEGELQQESGGTEAGLRPLGGDKTGHRRVSLSGHARPWMRPARADQPPASQFTDRCFLHVNAKPR